MGVPAPNHHKCSAVVELSMEKSTTFQGFYPLYSALRIMELQFNYGKMRARWQRYYSHMTTLQG